MEGGREGGREGEREREERKRGHPHYRSHELKSLPCQLITSNQLVQILH